MLVAVDKVPKLLVDAPPDPEEVCSAVSAELIARSRNTKLVLSSDVANEVKRTCTTITKGVCCSCASSDRGVTRRSERCERTRTASERRTCDATSLGDIPCVACSLSVDRAGARIVNYESLRRTVVIECKRTSDDVATAIDLE